MMKSLFFFLTGILFFTSLHAQLPDYLPANGLVGWWPFNGNANDESGNGNDGVVNGAELEQDRNGNFQKCYRFTDNTSITCAINQSINTLYANQNFSISEWFKIEQYPYGVFSFLTIYNPANDLGWEIIHHSGTGGFYFVSNNSNFGPLALPIASDQWHHFGFVCNNLDQTYQLYFDGQLLYSGFIGLEIPEIASGSLVLGASPNGTDESNIGAMDDIALYNRSLTQSEMQSFFLAVDNNTTQNGVNSIPQLINYQATARTSNGQPLSNSNLQVRFTLLADSLNGASEYVETLALTTNAFGLFTTAFGSGTPVTNTFAAINWAAGNKYLKVELDAGQGYVDMGTQQLLSVPFALRSKSAGEIENDSLPVYPNNAAALAGGLTAGKMYRTATGDLKVVY